MSKQALSAKDIEKHFNHACLLHEHGDLQEAVKEYKSLLSILPDLPQLHFNCGLALYELEHYQEAEEHYLSACTLCPEDPDIHYNRGLNFRRLDQIKDAADSFERAFQLGDHDLETYYNLGLCYQDLGEFSQAALLYDSILSTNPKHSSTLNNYAYLCHKTGDTQKAEVLYRRLLELRPEHQAARHMLNSLSGVTPDTAPLEYVEAVFDNYAQDFEHSLVEQLSYKTPLTLWERYCVLFPQDQRKLCLDLGCGTGLAGEQFSPYCRRIIGVDISKEMLTVAEEKNLYDDLIKSDITKYLSETRHSPDMIVAADVFTYLGNLETVFQKCFLVAEQGGLFLFSVEDSDNNKFEIKETGRFGHSPDYIRDLSQKTGWTLRDQHHSNLRQEKGKWISGYLFILEK
ncbi:MAG: tetratricopeptide repeat protein [Proteobacteria bacterium]|nr:tetratricopeptide repeat protein [Pseudomonadota bacterium]MBU1454448.1 tetratricopeptide repeat protein [Pseudomonadota bacterium]